MLRQLSIFIGVLVFAFFISACTMLKSEHYVGQKEIIPTKELKKETIWQYEEDVFYLRVLDSLNVIVSSLEWDKSTQNYKVINYDVVFTKLGDDKFLNVKGTDNMYTILRMVAAEDGTIAFFTVNEDFIKIEIEQGRVKAKEDGSDYVLDISKQELDQYVSENINDLFKIKTPGIIKPLVDITRN